MISHQREKGNEANPDRFKMIQKTRQTMEKDGLNMLKYNVIVLLLNPTPYTDCGDWCGLRGGCLMALQKLLL